MQQYSKHHSRIYSMQVAVLLTAAIMGLVEANYLFEIQFYTYRNPLRASAQAQGGCCDAVNANSTPPDCRSDCDTYLQICLRNSSIETPAGAIDCPFGYLETDEIVNRGGDNILFGTETLDITGDIPNPALFQNNQPWPGAIQVVILSIDQDSGDDDFIDILQINLNQLDVQSPEFTQRTMYNGLSGYSRYELSFRVSCALDYYGEDCTVFCRGRNDSLGRYYCNEAGEIQCLEGYTDPSTNCTQCETSAGCFGGFCIQPFECICFEGFSGENCTLTPATPLNNGAEIGGIIGGVIIVFFLLLVSLITVLATAVVCSKRKETVSTNEDPNYDSTIRRTSAGNRVFQENTSYIDLIARDSLSRSTELIISSGGTHYQLETPPKTHIKKLSTSTDRKHQSYTGVEPPVYTEPSAFLSHSDTTGVSDTGSSTSLHKVECYSSTLIGQNRLTEEMRTKHKPKPKPKPKNRAQSTTDLTEDESIPMKRNNSYQMLDTGEMGTEPVEGGDMVYSYPRLHHKDKGTHTGYTTVGATNEHGAYSKIELCNMYENIETAEEMMIENELYGSQRQYFETGLDDSYANNGLGPQ